MNLLLAGSFLITFGNFSCSPETANPNGSSPDDYVNKSFPGTGGGDLFVTT